MLHIILNPVEPLIEDGSVLDVVGDVLPEIGEVGSIEGSMDGILFLAMVSEEG